MCADAALSGRARQLACARMEARTRRTLACPVQCAQHHPPVPASPGSTAPGLGARAACPRHYERPDAPKPADGRYFTTADVAAAKGPPKSEGDGCSGPQTTPVPPRAAPREGADSACRTTQGPRRQRRSIEPARRPGGQTLAGAIQSPGTVPAPR